MEGAHVETLCTVFARALGPALLLARFPLSVLALRWLTQRRIRQLMSTDAHGQPQRPAFERHDPTAELRAAVQPRFGMHDARHGSADAAAVREAFVVRP